MATLEHRHNEELNKLTISLINLRNIAKRKNYLILLTRARKIIKSEEKKKFKIGPHDIILTVTLIFATIYHFIEINNFFCKIIIKLNLEFLSKCV